MHCLKQIWSYLYHEKPKEIFENSEFKNMYIVQAEILQDSIVQTLISLASHQHYNALMKNGYIISLVKYSLKVLQLFSKEKNHSSFMLERSFEIFIQIIIPLLKVSPEEVQMMEDDPQEFVNSSADVCESRESDDVKTATAELLLAIDTNVDGMLTFIVDFCVELLQKVVQKSNIESQ